MRKKKNWISRRDFMSKSITGMASVGLAATSLTKPIRADGAGSLQEFSGEMITRSLGKTGLTLPIVNMGVMNTLAPELVKRSYELGVRHFDTAAVYMRGQNETMVGQAVKDLGIRDKIVIGTKVFIPQERRPALTSEQIKKYFIQTAEASLRRLQTDYIDIFYVHNVSETGYLHNAGILEAMETLKDQKKIRFFGFTTHTNMANCIALATQKGFYDVVETAFNYAMADNKALINNLKVAHNKGMGIVAMKTQCSQYWYRDMVSGKEQQFYRGSIMHTAVLKWALRHEFIHTAIPGYTSFKQMEEDLSVAFGLEYTAEEKKFLEDRKVIAGLGACVQCQNCVPSCPAGVDIPTLMRTHMYAACYGNFHAAREAVDSLPKGKDLDACRSCSSCRAECQKSVDIPRRIHDLKLIYA
jgi:predicted aldo/keto reductase-like oxidoreductase